MDQDLINSAASVGGQIASYGVTGALGILCVAVVYLYRQVGAMSQRIQDIVERYASDIRDLAVAAQKIVAENTSAFSACEKSLDEVKSAINSLDPRA